MEQRYIILITKDSINVCLEYELAKQFKKLNITMPPTRETDTNVKFFEVHEIECATLKSLITWLRAYRTQETLIETGQRAAQEVLNQFCEEHKNLAHDTIMDLASGATYLGLNVFVFMLKYLINQKLDFHKSYERGQYSKQISEQLRLEQNIEPKGDISSAVERLTSVRGNLETYLRHLCQSRERTASDTKIRSGDIKNVSEDYSLSVERSKVTYLQKNLKSAAAESFNAVQEKPTTSYHAKKRCTDNFVDMNREHKNEQTHLRSKESAKTDNYGEARFRNYAQKEYEKLKRLKEDTEMSTQRQHDEVNELQYSICNDPIHLYNPHQKNEFNVPKHGNQKCDSPTNQLIAEMNAYSNHLVRKFQSPDYYKNICSPDQEIEFCASTDEVQKQRTKIKEETATVDRHYENVLTDELKSAWLQKALETRNQEQSVCDVDGASYNDKRRRDSITENTQREEAQCDDNAVANILLESRHCDDCERYNQLLNDEYSTNAYEKRAQCYYSNKDTRKSNAMTDAHLTNKLGNSNSNKKEKDELETIMEVKEYRKRNSKERISFQVHSSTHLGRTLSKAKQTNSHDQSLKQQLDSSQLERQEVHNVEIVEGPQEAHLVEDAHTSKLTLRIKCVYCERILRVKNIEKVMQEIEKKERTNNLEKRSQTRIMKQSAAGRKLKTKLLTGIELNCNSFGHQMDSVHAKVLVDAEAQTTTLKNFKNSSAQTITLQVQLTEMKISVNSSSQTDRRFNAINASVQTETLWSINSSCQTECWLNAVSALVQTEVFWLKTSFSQTDRCFNAVNTAAQTMFFRHTSSSSQTDIWCNTVNATVQTEFPLLMSSNAIHTDNNLQQISPPIAPRSRQMFHQNGFSSLDSENTPFIYSTHFSETIDSTSGYVDATDTSDDNGGLMNDISSICTKTNDSISSHARPQVTVSNDYADAVEMTEENDGSMKDTCFLRSESETLSVRSTHFSETIETASSCSTLLGEASDNYAEALATSEEYDLVMKDILLEIELMKFK